MGSFDMPKGESTKLDELDEPFVGEAETLDEGDIEMSFDEASLQADVVTLAGRQKELEKQRDELLAKMKSHDEKVEGMRSEAEKVEAAQEEVHGVRVKSLESWNADVGEGQARHLKRQLSGPLETIMNQLDEVEHMMNLRTELLQLYKDRAELSKQRELFADKVQAERIRADISAETASKAREATGMTLEQSGGVPIHQELSARIAEDEAQRVAQENSGPLQALEQELKEVEQEIIDHELALKPIPPADSQVYFEGSADASKGEVEIDVDADIAAHEEAQEERKAA